MTYPGLYFTHIAYVTFFINPTPQKNSHEPTHYISLRLSLSLTQPNIGGVRIQEENRCTMHVLTLRAQPHPRGYTVELISLRNGSPHANLNTVAVVYLGRSCTTPARNKV